MQRIMLLPSCIILPLATASCTLLAAEPPSKSAVLLLTLIDEANGKPLPRGWATLHPAGEQRTQHNEVRPTQKKDETALSFAAEPGDYAIGSGQRAYTVGGLQFDPVDAPEQISLKADEKQELTIKFRARPLTPQEIDERLPMVAIGRVVDPQGNPLSDVEVRVATGWATLLGGGSTHTDGNGEYVLRFGPGIMMMNSKSQLQAAQFAVIDDRYLELSRSHDYQRMAFEISSELDGEEDIEKVVVKGTPARLDFVISKPAIVQARFVDQSGNAVAAPRVSLKSTTYENHEYRYRRFIEAQGTDGAAAGHWEAVPGRPWRLDSASARSPAVTFPTSGRYVVTLREHPAKDDDAAWLEIVSVRQTSDLPLDSVVSNDDPFARSPLSKRDCRAARKLIQKMAAVNERWLKGPPPELGEFSYRFVFNGEKRGGLRSSEVTVKPGDRQHGKHQGISYYSAIHRLAADPDDVIIRAYDAGPERTTISYSFRRPAGQAMGTGVAGSWAGYFSRQTVNGTLVIDSKRLVPLEWFDDKCRETFSNFAEVNPDQFVPLRIEVAKEGGMRFDWRFNWHPSGLWLFSESHDVGADQVIASVENVRIGAEKVEPLAD